MKKKVERKLVLAKETVRQLDRKLERVAGGTVHTWYCGTGYCESIHFECPNEEVITINATNC